MKRLMMVLILFASACLCGCGVVHSYPERERRYSSITAIQGRMLVDDVDYFLMFERPSYLTKWHVRGEL
jgi:hypothetical protein